jgi:hypothetical protein
MTEWVYKMDPFTNLTGTILLTLRSISRSPNIIPQFLCKFEMNYRLYIGLGQKFEQVYDEFDFSQILHNVLQSVSPELAVR